VEVRPPSPALEWNARACYGAAGASRPGSARTTKSALAGARQKPFGDERQQNPFGRVGIET
jgi:hypothetical protein